MPKTLHLAHNPVSAPQSFSAYSAAVEVTEDRRWLHISGQVGVTVEGVLAEGSEAQMRQCWVNILAILKEAGMGPEHLVKVTALLTDPADTALYRTTRDEMLAGAEPASTLMIVAGLASPDWKVEIEAIAAA